MRVSSNELFLNSFRQLQQRVARIQEQISSGKQLLRPSDDAAGAARLVELQQALETTRQYTANADMASNRLTEAEGALGGVSEALQRVRELALAGRNTHLTNADRHIIAEELSHLRDQAIGLANSRDGNNEYLFAGFQTASQPFSLDPAGQIAYQGDQGQRLLQLSSGRRIADSENGYDTFMAVRNGNGTFTAAADPANTGTGVIDAGRVADAGAYQLHQYRIVFTSSSTYDIVNDTSGTTVAPGQTYVEGADISFNGVKLSINGAPAAGDEFEVNPSTRQAIFTTVDNLIALLRSDPSNPREHAEFANGFNQGFSGLDQALEHVLQVRTAIGTRLSAVDNQREINEGVTLELQSLRSRIEDADMVGAITALNQELTALEAAQRAYVRTQNLSLFDLI